MKKAIATSPNKKTKYEDLSSEEVDEKTVSDEAWSADEDKRAWQSEMEALDVFISRGREEDISILSETVFNKLPTFTREKYNEKAALRKEGIDNGFING